ncbi:hypothetical protein FACS189479_08220 [Spirochaetia bacterium]|nr:hypothetical protein FACS189479_08220 [Spirochaetia bacterium]
MGTEKKDSMANNMRREQLSKGIDRLTEENRAYVLGISQALSFAQTAMNRPKDTASCGKEQRKKP